MRASASAEAGKKDFRLDTLLLLLLSGGIALFFLLPLSDGALQPGFPLDDGWIHATYARNLAADGAFAFNPGEPSSGSSSLLWTVLLATLMTLGAGPVAAASLPGIGSALLLIALWHRTLLSAGLPRLSAAFGAAALPLSGILFWWTLSGMETVLFLLFAVRAVQLLLQRRYVASGLACALLILTRPEGLLLAPVLAFAAWRDQRSLRPASILLACAASGAVIYAGINLAVSGSLMTSTFAGRRWLATGGRPPSADIVDMLSAAATMLYRWLRTVLWGVLRWAPIGTWALASLAAAVLLFSNLRAYFPAWRSEDTAAPESLPGKRLLQLLLAWGALHAIAYAVLLPYPGHAGRYLAPLLLSCAMLAALALLPLLRRTHSLRRNTLLLRGVLPRIVLPRAVLLAAIVLVAAGGLQSWRIAYRSSVEHINSVHRRAAEWIADSTASGATIAAYDIGAIGYFSSRRVIDLGGIVQPDVIPFMHGDIDAYIASTGADYVSMVTFHDGYRSPASIPAVLGYGQSGLLETCKKATFTCPPDKYRRHILLTGNAYPRIIIEKVAKTLVFHRFGLASSP